ncbi:MAG: flagellar filament capping protein FliD [Lachnospiraceae bacterium]
MAVSIGSMFSSLSGNQTMNNNTTSYQGLSLGDYAAIKNGSYGKLVKAYYKNQSEAETGNTGNKTDFKQNLTATKANAESLKKASDALMNADLWKKKSISSKDETTGETKTTNDYDWESITKAVKSFADSYNSVLTKTADSTNKNVLRNGVSMVQTTNRTVANMLGKVGITIGEDNKLSVDEEKLKKADISDLKTLFSGQGSFADQIATKASAIARATQNSSGIYTRNATYANQVNNLIAGSIDTMI